MPTAYKIVSEDYYSSNVAIYGLSRKSQWALRYEIGKTTEALLGSAGIMVYKSLRVAKHAATVYLFLYHHVKLLEVKTNGAGKKLQHMTPPSKLRGTSVKKAAKNATQNCPSDTWVYPSVTVIREIK